MRRRAVTWVAAWLCFCGLSGLAQAGEPRGDCRRITRQIEHFEGVAAMAEERDNELWEAETRRHIGRLELKRAGKCPRYAEELRERNRMVRVAKATQEFFKMAGKAAIRYFTFGAY